MNIFVFYKILLFIAAMTLQAERLQKGTLFIFLKSRLI